MSKLNTLRDGARVLRAIARLVQHERPLAFFGTIGIGLIVLAIALGIPLLETFAETGLVPPSDSNTGGWAGDRGRSEYYRRHHSGHQSHEPAGSKTNFISSDSARFAKHVKDDHHRRRSMNSCKTS